VKQNKLGGSNTALAWMMSLALLPLVVGCRVGGNVTASPANETTKAVIEIPVVTTPTKSPYYSSSSELQIQGLCKEGLRIELKSSSVGQSGDQLAEDQWQICEQSKYSFTVSKAQDGIYNFLISQINGLGNASPTVSLVWYKKSSVAPPMIVSPSGGLFKSSTDSMTLSGTCESGASLKVSGDGAFSGVCENSSFSIPVTQLQDGVYNLTLSQTDAAGNTASAELQWRRFTLKITPDLASAVVGSTIPLSFSGGSEIYTVSIPDNNSGGSFNSVSNSYILGTTAGKTDRIRLVDSNGTSVDALIETVPDVPDHFEIDSLAAVSDFINQLLVPFRARVVDRYGNGVANYPVNFRSSSGQSLLMGVSRQLTDSSGYATVTMNLAATGVLQKVSVSPLSGILPDLVGSGRTNLTVQKTMTAAGTGKLGNFFTTGQAPSRFTIHDFDGDGKKDVALLNVGDPSVGILRGQGNGMFSAMTKIQPLCLGPNGIEKGDFNLDGRMDLVVICGTTDRIGFLKGRSDGGFDLPVYSTITATVSLPVGFVSHDFNGDGKLDLAVVGANTSSAGLWLGTGTGSFTQGIDFAVGVSPSAIAKADLNKDGHMDLLVTSVNDSTIVTYLNSGAGTFMAQNTYATGGSPSEIVVEDFNSDGWSDVAIVNSGTDNLSVFLNDLSGALTPQSSLATGSGPIGITSMDYNSDGHRDLVVTNNGDSTFQVFQGQNNGEFISQSPQTTGMNPISVLSEDMNGDQLADLVVVNNGDQTLQFIPKQSDHRFGFSTTVGSSPTAVVSWDFDKDGKFDLAVLNNVSNTISIRKGLGNGIFQLESDLVVAQNSVHLTAADLNADGWVDLVVTSKDANSLRRFFGSAGGFQENSADLTLGSAPTSTTVGDYNGDGFLDFAAANGGGNSVSVLLSSGLTDSFSRTDYNTSGDPRSIKAVDVNNDKFIDLIFASASNGSVGILRGNGDGSFQNSVDYLTGTGAMDLVIEDFNFDGHLDLAVLNGIDGTVSVLLNVGNGSFDGKSDYFAATGPAAMGSADYNGDGRLDLIVTGGPGMGFTVLEGGTLGQFNNSLSFSTGYTTEGLTCSDLNGDHAADLILLSGSQSSAEIWMGH